MNDAQRNLAKQIIKETPSYSEHRDPTKALSLSLLDDALKEIREWEWRGKERLERCQRALQMCFELIAERNHLQAKLDQIVSPSPELVEAVARAIFDSDPKDSDEPIEEYHGWYHNNAKAALVAIAQHLGLGKK